VRAGLGALFEHHHRQIGLDLLEPDRRAQPGRPGPDDDHVVFHGLARAMLGKDFVWAHRFDLLVRGPGGRAAGRALVSIDSIDAAP
jgi:hypothetical protein